MSQYKCLIFVFIFLIGCQQPPSPPHYALEYFSWKSDGSEIISIETVDNIDPYTATEVVRYNSQGNEISRVKLSTAIDPMEYSDKLFLDSSGKNFYAQRDSTILRVNVTDGNVSVIAIGQYFVSSSPNGTIIFTALDPPLPHLDSNSYSINRLVNTLLKPISKWKISSHDEFGGIVFLNDSQSVTFIGPQNSRSLTIFDSSLNVLVSSRIQESTYQFKYASYAQKIAYLLYPSLLLSMYDIKSKNSIQVGNLSYPISFDVTTDATKIVYSSNSAQGYGIFVKYYGPNNLKVLNVHTNQENQIATDVNSSVQLSPDGSHVAYFSRDGDNIKLHVLSIQ